MKNSRKEQPEPVAGLKMNKPKKLLAAALALVLLCALLPSAALAAGTKYPIQVGTFQYGTVTVGNDATEAEEGDTVELTIVPSSGYKFVENSLKITGPANQTVPYDLTSAGGGLYRADFTMPGHAVSVSVQFTAITYKALTPRWIRTLRSSTHREERP